MREEKKERASHVQLQQIPALFRRLDLLLLTGQTDGQRRLGGSGDFTTLRYGVSVRERRNDKVAWHFSLRPLFRLVVPGTGRSS